MHGNCSCAECTVAFGQQLANTFHVWSEISSTAETHLDQVLCDIEASTSALQHLQALIDKDKTAAEGVKKIFTAAGLEEIEGLATKCDLLFKAIILLVQKASERKTTADSDDDDDDSKEKPDEKSKTDYKAELLTGPVPDPASMKTFGLCARLDRSKWSWLDDRITHCQEQLRYVRKGLFLHLQVARLSQSQGSGVDRENGAFESELVARGAISLLRKSQIRYVKRRARKQEEAQRLRDLREKRQEDNASIKSGSSQTSAKTVVDETAPVTKTLEAKEGQTVAPTIPPFPMPGPSPPPQAEATSGETQKAEVQVVTSAHAEMAKGAGSKEAKSTGTVSATSNKFGQKFSDSMTDLTHKFFGRDDEFSKDWPSETLEAWVTQGTPFSDPMKVPFGHRRLQYGLKQVRGKKAPVRLTTFDRYLEQGPRMQVVVDEVVREANRLQKRERVCLAFQQYRARDPRDISFALVFFSIQKEKPPIAFTDCIGRKTSIPYAVCKNWDGMRNTITEVCGSIPEIGMNIFQGHYDLLNARGEIILKGLWASALKPGDTIKMMMWPTKSHPLPRGVPVCTPQNADVMARQQRISRMQNALPPPLPPMNAGPCRPMMPGFVGAGQPAPAIPRCLPPHLRGPVIGPPMHQPALQGGRPPLPPPPGRWGPPGVDVVNRGRPRRKLSSFWTTTTVDKDKMTHEEEEQLSFVNYVDELEKVKDITVVALLSRYTHLRDVEGGFCFDGEWDMSAASESDSSSGSSSSGSSGSIVD